MHRTLAIPYPIPYPINRTRIRIGLLSDVKNLLPYPIKSDSKMVSDGNYPNHFHPDIQALRPRQVDRLLPASTTITPHIDRYPACIQCIKFMEKRSNAIRTVTSIRGPCLLKSSKYFLFQNQNNIQYIAQSDDLNLDSKTDSTIYLSIK